MLVPGFLGFSRFGGFYYFADRLVAVLRAILEAQLDRAVAVVPCTVLPTDALAARQQDLVAYLGRLRRERLPDVERLHLVGHSTGGVDAQLLACETRLDGSAWSATDRETLAGLTTVVTISAPHHGTGLANSRLARFAEHPLADPFAPVVDARLLADLGILAFRDVAALAGLQAARLDDIVRFVGRIVASRALVHDLRPDSMAAVRRRARQRGDVALTCFASGTVDTRNGVPVGEPFFRDLYALTRDGEDVPAPAAARALLRAAATEGRVITSAPPPPPDVCLDMNDGVVNTARQVLAEGKLAALVLADHADVLGHYDRQDDLIDGRSYNAGLFHSGAGFRDAEFFALYRRVARAIAAGIPGATSAVA